MKNNMISVYCWECSKRFEIEIRNVVAGRLFCSNECETKNGLELEKIKEKE